MKRNARRPGIVVTTGGQGVVSHAGARLLCELADDVGLTDALSEAMAPTKQRRRGHDRGQVLVDMAVAIADGATTLSDVRVLGDQPGLFGDVASVPTMWRTLEATDRRPRAHRGCSGQRSSRCLGGRDGPGLLRDRHRRHARQCPLGQGGCGAELQARFRFPPPCAFLDATGEALAALLRPGNAAPGSAEDHVRLLDAALAQLPVDPHDQRGHRPDRLGGCQPRFLDACRSVASASSWATASAPSWPPGPQHAQNRWLSTISADGTEERDAGVVAEVTDLVDLGLWPEGTRMFVRREEPHPGAQLTFSDIDGHRYQLFITDHAEDDVCFLEALYRGRGRGERRICDAKDTGLENLPSASFAINEAWLALVVMASDLLVWMRGLCLEGALQKAEPKRLRYTLLHSAGVLVRSARRTTLRIAAGWPWADDLVAAFTRLPNWSSA